MTDSSILDYSYISGSLWGSIYSKYLIFVSVHLFVKHFSICTAEGGFTFQVVQSPGVCTLIIKYKLNSWRLVCCTSTYQDTAH